MTPKQEFYAKQAATLIKNLAKRNIEGYFCATPEEAKDKVMGLIAAGSTVASGGSMTLEECGVMSALRARTDVEFFDRAKASSKEETEKVYRQAFSADVYLTSTNAITLDGELINIDGNGNRVAALIFGPKEVIVVTGMNKVAVDEASGIARVRNIASPPNCVRLHKNTPCAVTGRCGDCYGDDCICSQIVVTRRSRDKGRIKVILVGAELGY